MCNDLSAPPLIGLLQAALNNPIERSRLLQQQELIREIMNDIPTRQWLFLQACQTDYPNRGIDLITAMIKSSRLLRHGGRISPDVYGEALSRTWVWFVEDFDQYNPQKASFVTWFNQKLGWVILDVIREKADEARRQLHPPASEEDTEWIYPPAPEPERWHETIQEWLELVKNHSHLFKDCRMQSPPHFNCQVLLIQILTVLGDSGEFSWNTIAQKYEVEPLVLKRFCRTRCFPRFKQLLSE
ncbi:MAG: hypothetical protein KME21_11320 [Desmonostoc vinosum HA7617-LM4]|jgi:hypothetical protein|nr:hypothetical protein [Desmonostoc vinosum HA7617-LM4]